MYFYAFLLITLLLDQVIKTQVAAKLVLGQSVPLIGNLVKLTYVRNTGAAFSLFVGFSSYLAVIGLVVTAIVVYFHFKISRRDYFTQTALAFILGGSLGNLFDRILRGYVVDYLDFGFWPVFNLADTMINVGVFMILIVIWQSSKNKGAN